LTKFALSHPIFKHHLQIADMPGLALHQLLPLRLVSFIHRVTSAATNRILVSHEDSKSSSEFDASRHPSISEWIAAQGRILESANNATKECLSQFTIDEDSSACYGEDEWEWNGVATICVTAVVACMLILLWLCCDWTQTCLLRYLGDAAAHDRSCPGHDKSSFRQDGKVKRVNAKKSHRRVDSVLSQTTVEAVHPKVKDVEQSIDSVQTDATAGDLLSLPVMSADGSGSKTHDFREFDSALRKLGWLP
jgi:hypothetical protein